MSPAATRATAKRAGLDPYDPIAFVSCVRAAGPEAARLLLEGLLDPDGDLVGRIQELSGDTGRIEADDEELPRIIRWITAGYALGIQVGMRLQPGAFDANGGGR